MTLFELVVRNGKESDELLIRSELPYNMYGREAGLIRCRHYDSVSCSLKVTEEKSIRAVIIGMRHSLKPRPTVATKVSGGWQPTQRSGDNRLLNRGFSALCSLQVYFMMPFVPRTRELDVSRPSKSALFPSRYIRLFVRCL